MKPGSEAWSLAACIAFSVVAHAALLFLSAPVRAPERAVVSTDGFRMIQAVVAARPKPAVIPPRPKPVPKVSEAAIVSEKPPEEPALELPEELPPEPAQLATEATDDAGAVAEAGPVGLPGQGAGSDFLPFYKVDVRPEFLFKAELVFPLQARKLGREGTVIVEADIDEKGILADIRLVKKAGFGFDEAATDMIRASRFAPAYAAGRPVPVRMRFTVNFKLKG